MNNGGKNNISTLLPLFLFYKRAERRDVADGYGQVFQPAVEGKTNLVVYEIWFSDFSMFCNHFGVCGSCNRADRQGANSQSNT